MLDNDIYEMKVEQAKKRIRDAYNVTDGKIYLSFSGGKDSTVVLSLIRELKINIPAVFSDTGLELRATRDFVKWVSDNYYNNVVIVKPEKAYDKVIEKGKPFRSKIKSSAINYYQKNPLYKTARLLYDDSYKTSQKIRLANKDFHILHPEFSIKINDNCCDELKKKPFLTYEKFSGAKGCITGMRAFEGGRREFNYYAKLRAGKSPCTEIKRNGNIQKSPIIDWSDEMREMYITKNNVPLSRAYTVYGLDRTGCFLCPYGINLSQRLEILYKYEPNTYKAAIYYMGDIYIAQGVKLVFDENYMKQYNTMWAKYEKMRYEMLLKYRPDCNIVKKGI